VAFPIPLVGLSVTHAASERADQSQSRVELTVMFAVPPACETVRVVVEAETTQRTDVGAMTSVWLVTPPQPAVRSKIATVIPPRLSTVDMCSAWKDASGGMWASAALAHGSPMFAFASRDLSQGLTDCQALHSPSRISGANSVSSPIST
jgi:hypothetical protein